MLTSALAAVAACARPIPVTAPAPDPDAQPARAPVRVPPRAPAGATTGGGNGTSTASSFPYQPSRWPVRYAEHVDLWLHAFALVSDDTTRVPLFARGYRDSLTVVKNRTNVLTSLDVNRQALARKLASSPRLQQAQFLAFEFPNWDAMRSAAERVYVREGGDTRGDRGGAAGGVNPFVAMFPTADDREWLRLFVTGVQDEQLRFFNAEHSRLVRSRSAIITAVDSLWQGVYRPKFDRFLNNTNQRTGELLLSIPLGGEGRTGTGRDRQTVVAVPFPARVQDAHDVILAVAHEITGGLVTGVIADNTTPSEQRSGMADRYIAMAQVRAGSLLLERLAPELVDAYMRYYLAQSGIRTDVAGGGASGGAATADVKALFLRTYDIPVAIRDGIQKQIDIVLGGI
jgi:hypothetical protein